MDFCAVFALRSLVRIECQMRMSRLILVMLFDETVNGMFAFREREGTFPVA